MVNISEIKQYSHFWSQFCLMFKILTQVQIRLSSDYYHIILCALLTSAVDQRSPWQFEVFAIKNEAGRETLYFAW